MNLFRKKEKRNYIIYDDVVTRKDTVVYVNGVRLDKYICFNELEQILNALSIPFTVEFRSGQDD